MKRMAPVRIFPNVLRLFEMKVANSICRRTAYEGGPYLEVQWHGWMMARCLDIKLDCFVVPRAEDLQRRGKWQFYQFNTRFSDDAAQAVGLVRIPPPVCFVRARHAAALSTCWLPPVWTVLSACSICAVIVLKVWR